jgi:septum formation protein
VRLLAQRKAEAIHVNGPAVIIGADTVVSINAQILGKPKDADDACRMLRLLQGTRHTVYTGVCLIRQGASPSVQAFVDHTDVYIRPLTAGEILEYVQTGEPFDKAGAYGAQGMGCTLISRVDGDYNTVVGLPLVRVYLALRDLAQGDAAA